MCIIALNDGKLRFNTARMKKALKMIKNSAEIPQKLYQLQTQQVATNI